MTTAARTIVDNWVAQHPGKAAKGSVHLLASTDERERQRGRDMAAALRSADRCAVCGRQLRTDESRRIGIGPECRHKTGEVRRALTALRAAGFDVADPDHLEADITTTPTDLTNPQPRPERGPKVREGKAWEPENSDHSPNVGCYAVQAACGMVDLAVELELAHGRTPTERHVRWAATRLLEACDEIQAGVRSDGRSERMDTSHARARGVLHRVLDFVPFPIDAANDLGIVRPDRADDVHRWHADAVNAGIALLRIAVDASGVDWRTAA